ncbi:MAG TPA: hypothetical protein VFI49_15510 [Rudaea sp.]|nr:hypothetical protein [Rudaea sp.]
MLRGSGSFAAFVLSAGLLTSGSVSAQDGSADFSWPNFGAFTFDGDASATSSPSRLDSLAVEANGRLLLGGTMTDAGYWWLGELLPDGTFASGFGTSGSGRITACQLGSSCGGNAGLFSALPAGSVYAVVANDAVRLTTAAAQMLGPGVTVPIPVNDNGGTVVPLAAAVQPDGKIVVVGKGYYSGADYAGGKSGVGVARFTGTLGLDHSFNAITDAQNVTFDGGAVIAASPTDSGEAATSVSILPSGGIQLAGIGTGGLYIVRLHGDGSVDVTFGTNGIINVPWAGHLLQSAHGFVDRAGRMVIAVQDTQQDGLLFTLVSATGNTVQNVFQPTANFECDAMSAVAIAADSAGRFLVGGDCTWSSNHQQYFIVLRVRADTYALDTTFGAAEVGWVLRRFDGSAAITSTSALAFDGGGRPVIAGASASGTYFFRSGIARLNYNLIYTNNFEVVPRGCLPPDCI